MHAIVNHLPIKPDADWGTICVKVDEFNALVQDPDFRGVTLVRAGENEAILLVLFATQSSLQQVSREVAGPWFAEHLRPFLSGPAQRTVGEVIAGALHGVP